MPVSEEVKKKAQEALGVDLGNGQLNLDEETLAELVRLREMQQLEVTPAEQWNSPRKQGFLVQLPSGQVIRVRRTMNIVKAIEAGTLPNPLNETVQRNIAAGSPELVLPNLSGLEAQQAMDLIDQTVLLAVVEPPVKIPPEDQSAELWEPPPGCLSIMDVTMTDRLFIAQVAQGGSTDLDKFREQQEIVVEPVPASERVERKAQQPNRAQRRATKRPAKT